LSQKCEASIACLKHILNVHYEHRIRGFYLNVPLVRKLVLFCADRTKLVFQTLHVADQRNNTGTTHRVSSAWFLMLNVWFLCTSLFNFMCVCVCVWEREREKESGREDSEVFHTLLASGPTYSVRIHRRIQRQCQARCRHARAPWREFELYVPNSGNFFAPLCRISAAKILQSFLERLCTYSEFQVRFRPDKLDYSLVRPASFSLEMTVLFCPGKLVATLSSLALEKGFLWASATNAASWAGLDTLHNPVPRRLPICPAVR
jgi:hypothetical protein